MKRNIGVLPGKFVRLQIDVYSVVAGKSHRHCRLSEDLPLELRPFRVHLLVAFDIPQQSPQARIDCSMKFRKNGESMYGSHWNLTVGATDHLHPSRQMPGSVGRRANVSRQPKRKSTTADVWLAAQFARTALGWRLMFGRGSLPSDWRQMFGADLYDRLDLPTNCFEFAIPVFRPIGVVDEWTGRMYESFFKECPFCPR